MGIQLHGLLAALIFLATVGATILATLLCLALFIFEARGWREKTETRRSGYFLLTGILFLIFHGMFYIFLSGRTLSSEQGEALDWWMLYVWIPCHLIGYFLFPFVLRYVLSTKTDQLVEKWHRKA